MSRHIKPEIARELAYSWHGGQWSPLYAFASSGLVENLHAVLYEISQCSNFPGNTKTEQKQLLSLYRFVRDCLAKTPNNQYPFAAPWAK